uniref:Zn(2)-C6 fungal-type domain-containing protein n=1 Tax=viral metagenome TaxID=1070528 RepID=A0A6C0BI59_9ZZZZ
MSCDQCAKVGIAKFCSMGQPCFQCNGRKIKCTYGVPLTANNVLQPFKEALTKGAQSPKKEFTSAEVAAGAASRAGSPAYEVSNAENSNVEEAKQAALRQEVVAMTKKSQLNKNNKNKKRKSRKSRKSKQSRKLKHK